MVSDSTAGYHTNNSTVETFTNPNDNPPADYFLKIWNSENGRQRGELISEGNALRRNYNRILKDVKKEFCCNGNVVQDKELGKVIQLQCDQCKNVSNFLIKTGLVKKDDIKIHGF